MILDLLVQLGLSKKEARVYLMLLRIGTAPASSLAKRSDVKRVSIYSLLESLEGKGLVVHKIISGYRHFQALDPQQLMYALQKQSAELKMQMSLARQCIECLEGLNSSRLVLNECD